MGKMAQAKEAVQYGLQFDPTNLDMVGLLRDIELVLRSYASQPRPPANPWEVEDAPAP